MESLKIGIVEDDFLIAESIVDALQNIGYRTTEPVRTFDAALNMITTETPDLVLLDIEIEGEKDGIDIGMKINEEHHLPFIFLTAFSDNATVNRAKKANPYAYLVKPFNEGDLFTAIEVAFNSFNNTQPKVIQPAIPYSKKIIFIKNGDLFQKVEVDNILYIESENVYLNIHLLNNKHYVVRTKMEDFINEFPINDLVRIHRSYAVNLRHIDSINTQQVYMQGKDIPIGKNYKEDLMQRVKVLK